MEADMKATLQRLLLRVEKEGAKTPYASCKTSDHSDSGTSGLQRHTCKAALSRQPTISSFMKRTFAMDSPLVTHVLNTEDGVPAARMALSLHHLDPQMALWNLITTGTTDENGHCSELITRKDFPVGMYKLRFETGQYWEHLGQTSFYPYVEIVFSIADWDQRFHVPLHLGRYTYSVYRWSCRQ